MKIGNRIIIAFLAILIMSLGISSVAFASTKKKKKINTVSVRIEGNIEIDTRMGEESIDVSTSANNYHYDYYTVENTGFRWTSEDTPEIKIYLNAEDGYVFNITKASQININGGTYKSAARENSSTTLVISVKLPSLKNQVYPIEYVNFTEDGKCTWSKSEGAGYYEVKFVRGQTNLGGIHKVTDTSADFSQYITKSGNYYFKVRPINRYDNSVAGLWVDSNHIYISDYQAGEMLKKIEDAQSNGTWIKDDIGWWFRTANDGYPRATWRKINGERYYFNDKGYMATGWQYIDGNWYYLDPVNGNMWKNATTPDGFFVGIDGSRSK